MKELIHQIYQITTSTTALLSATYGGRKRRIVGSSCLKKKEWNIKLPLLY
jgi:hypothetical protein